MFIVYFSQVSAITLNLAEIHLFWHMDLRLKCFTWVANLQCTQIAASPITHLFQTLLKTYFMHCGIIAIRLRFWQAGFDDWLISCHTIFTA